MNKVAKYGLEQEVIRLRGMGFGYPSIASQINTLHGISLSHMAIKRFLDSSDKTASKVLSEKEKQREKLMETKLNVVENLASANVGIDEAIENHRGNWRAHTAYLDLKIKNTAIIFKLTKNIKLEEKRKEDPLAYQRMFHVVMDKVFKGAELKDGKLVISDLEVINYYKSTNNIWD